MGGDWGRRRKNVRVAGAGTAPVARVERRRRRARNSLAEKGQQQRCDRGRQRRSLPQSQLCFIWSHKFACYARSPSLPMLLMLCLRS